MVQIPKLGTQARISPEVPRESGPDIRQAGAAGRAVQTIGGVVSQLGEFGAQIAAKRQKAEDSHYMNTAINELQMNTVAYSTEASRKLEGTDYRGFTQSNDEYIKEQSDLILSNAPTENAKNKLRMQLDNFKTESYINNDTTESYSPFVFRNTSTGMTLSNSLISMFR